MNNPLLFPNPNKTLSWSLLLWLFVFWGVLSNPLLGSELNPFVNSASDCPAEAAQVEAVEVGCIAGTLNLEATVIAEPVIPYHFEQIFLLASGANRTIVALNDQPQFTVTEAGEYSIHSLVYGPLPSIPTISVWAISGWPNWCCSLNKVEAYSVAHWILRALVFTLVPALAMQKQEH